jgi:hypothetical protein
MIAATSAMNFDYLEFEKSPLDRCDQEGCSEPATIWYRMKNLFCACGVSKEAKHSISDSKLWVQFCERHSTRGDCGLEDADDNYELIKGSPISPREEDCTKSIFGGIV